MTMDFPFGGPQPMSWEEAAPPPPAPPIVYRPAATFPPVVNRTPAPGEGEIITGVPLALGPIPGLITGIGAAVPWLTGITAAALTAWGIYELASGVFGGEGGFPGVGGGGGAPQTAMMAGALPSGTTEGTGMTMTPFGGQYGIRGPGVPEPAPGTVAAQWSVVVNSRQHGTFRIYYFKMFTGEILMYNPAKRAWKKWRPKKPLAVMYRGKTTLSQAIKVQSYLDKMWRKVAKKTKAIKMA